MIFHLKLNILNSQSDYVYTYISSKFNPTCVKVFIADVMLLQMK